MTARIPFVLGVIFFLTDSGSRPYVVSSMSAKTGTAPCISIDDAVADIVKGEVITSSPGPMPALDTAACAADVAELNEIACFTPKNFFYLLLHFFNILTSQKPISWPS